VYELARATEEVVYARVGASVASVQFRRAVTSESASADDVSIQMICRYKCLDDTASGGESTNTTTPGSLQRRHLNVEARKPKGYGRLAIKQLDVPTTKDELSRWLNETRKGQRRTSRLDELRLFGTINVMP
jgi:hypothetical protein